MISLTLFQGFINYVLKVVEEARQGVQVGGSEISGILFGDDCAGMSATPDGLGSRLSQRWNLLGSGDTQQMSTTVFVIIGNKSTVQGADLREKWGDEELPRVDRYTYLDVKSSDDCK